MALTITGSSDYLYRDLNEQVQVYSQVAPGQYFPVDASISALRGQARQTERASSLGVYTAFELDWYLPAPELVAAPKPADQVLDSASVVWTILSAEFDPFLQEYLCKTIDLALTFGLTDTISVSRATLSYDAAGGLVRVWSTVIYSAIAARVQLQEETDMRERGLRGKQYDYSVIVGQQVAVTAEDRITWTPASSFIPAGLGAGPYVLTIRGVKQPQRLDELPIIDAYLAI